MEFSEWLYCQQFPIDDVAFHLNWAIDIVLTMTPAQEALEPAGEPLRARGPLCGLPWLWEQFRWREAVLPGGTVCAGRRRAWFRLGLDSGGARLSGGWS